MPEPILIWRQQQYHKIRKGFQTKFREAIIEPIQLQEKKKEDARKWYREEIKRLEAEFEKKCGVGGGSLKR